MEEEHAEAGKAPDVERKTATQKGAWTVMVFVWIAGIAMSIAQYKVSAVMLPMQQSLGIDSASAGWVQGVFTFTGIVLAFPAVAIIRKWGVRIGGIIAIAFAIAGGIIGFFAGDFAALIFSRIIEGFGLGLIGIIAPAAIAMWFQIEKRGAPMGLWSCWQMVGISLCFYCSVPMMSAFGSWKSLWIVSVIILLVALVLYAMKVKEPPVGRNHADVQNEGTKITKVFTVKSAWIIGLAAFAFGLSNSVVISWISPYWQTQVGMDAATATNLTGVLFTIECFGCVIAGVILNHIKKRRIFIVVDSILYAVVFFLIFRVNSFEGSIVLMVLYAIIESGFCCAMWTLVSQSVPDPRLAPGAMALYTMFIDIGMMLGPVIAGSLIDSAGYGSVAYFVCIAQLAAAVFWGILKLYNEKGEIVRI
jgi:predicted MFS family arabinose efflux permease